MKLRITILIVSGRIGEEATAEAMRAGADDYVLKDHLGTLTARHGTGLGPKTMI